MDIRHKKVILLIIISSLILITLGCQQTQPNIALAPTNRLLEKDFNNPPKKRLGSYATPSVGTTFLEPHNLGVHSYKFDLKEKNGIVYTCKAGHVDISHVREAADWTAYLAAVAYKNLSNNDSEFSFILKEGSVCFVHLTYPDNWQNLSNQDREKIAFDMAIGLGQYFASIAGTWHEILTWYGYKSKMVFSEFPSAFSWEDTYSNMVGCDIGAKGLRDTKYTYEESVTNAIDKELDELEGQSAELAKYAAEKVKGLWFTGNIPPFVNMKKRNFDIGLSNGFVTPILVDSINLCEGATAQSHPVPNLKFLAKQRFSMKFEIEPKVWEEDKILKVVYHLKKPGHRYIEPEKDFAHIMSEIQLQAQKGLLTANTKPKSASRRLYN